MKNPVLVLPILAMLASSEFAGAHAMASPGASGAVMTGRDGLSPPARPASADQLLRRDAAIEQAVRATVAERPSDRLQQDDGRLRGDSYASFRRQVDDAVVPDCLHPDGLKRQPTFFLAGLLAVPFVAVAKVRGKCQ